MRHYRHGIRNLSRGP